MRYRHELSHFPRRQAMGSAKTLYRYGRSNLKAVQESKSPNRQRFMSDVRRGKWARPLSFIYDFFEVPTSPQARKKRQ